MSDLPGVDLARLDAYLASAAPGLVTGPLSAELVTGGRSNLTYYLTDGEHRWVLRRPPLGHVLSTAHDMGPDVQAAAFLGYKINAALFLEKVKQGICGRVKINGTGFVGPELGQRIADDNGQGGVVVRPDIPDGDSVDRHDAKVRKTAGCKLQAASHKPFAAPKGLRLVASRLQLS